MRNTKVPESFIVLTFCPSTDKPYVINWHLDLLSVIDFEFRNKHLILAAGNGVASIILLVFDDDAESIHISFVSFN